MFIRCLFLNIYKEIFYVVKKCFYIIEVGLYINQKVLGWLIINCGVCLKDDVLNIVFFRLERIVLNKDFVKLRVVVLKGWI